MREFIDIVSESKSKLTEGFVKDFLAALANAAINNLPKVTIHFANGDSKALDLRVAKIAASHLLKTGGDDITSPDDFIRVARAAPAFATKPTGKKYQVSYYFNGDNHTMDIDAPDARTARFHAIKTLNQDSDILGVREIG